MTKVECYALNYSSPQVNICSLLGTYDAVAGQGAIFQRDSCWWILGDVCEHLDGDTGFLWDSNIESKLSPFSLHSLISSLKIPTPSETTTRMKELLVSELEKL